MFSASAGYDYVTNHMLCARAVDWQDEGERRALVSIMDQHKDKGLFVEENFSIYEEIFETSLDAIAILDKNSRVSKISKSFSEIFGYSKKEVLNREIIDFIYEQDKLIVEKETKRRHSGYKGDYEIRFTHKDGFPIWCRVAASGFFDKQSNYHGCLAMISDITERKQLQKEIIMQKTFLETIIQKLPEAIAVLDNEQNIITTNEAFTKLFGYQLEEIKGQNLDDVLDRGKEKSANREKTLDVLSGKEVTDKGFRYSKDGKPLYVNVKASPIIIDGEIVGAVSIYIDTTSQKEYEAYLEKTSLHDSLTGLYNRTFLNRQLTILQADDNNFPVAVIMADMDGLKDINDTYGHTTGDEYLKKCGEIFSSCTRRGDIVARIGGDEFCILIPSADEKLAQKVIGRITEAVEACNKGKKLPVPLSISLGYSIAQSKADLPDKALNEADSFMYRNKAIKKAVNKSKNEKPHA